MVYRAVESLTKFGLVEAERRATMLERIVIVDSFVHGRCRHPAAHCLGQKIEDLVVTVIAIVFLPHATTDQITVAHARFSRLGLFDGSVLGDVADVRWLAFGEWCVLAMRGVRDSLHCID